MNNMVKSAVTISVYGFYTSCLSIGFKIIGHVIQGHCFTLRTDYGKWFSPLFESKNEKTCLI